MELNDSSTLYRLRNSGSSIAVLHNYRNLSPFPTCIASFLRNEFFDGDAFSSEIAYIMYTSGTTGEAKGVVIGSRNVDAFAFWLQSAPFQVSQSDYVMFLTSVSFDTFLENLLWPVISLASSVIVPHDGERDLSIMEKMFSRTTIGMVTPSYFRAICSVLYVAVPLLVFAGENLTMHGMPKHSGEVWNAYGPTETTDYVCQSTVRGYGRIVIGRPIHGVQIRSRGGTLQVGGRSVGLGYKGRAEATRRVFVYDTASNDGGSRAYETGDRGRFERETGELEYLGRRDEQVKIGGVRVEMAGVEAAVSGCRGVEACAVVMEGERLTAFVVGRTTASEVRGELSGWVSRHEAPQRVVVVERVPLTAAGKVDRRKLKEWAAEREDKVVVLCDDVSAKSDGGVREAMERVLGRRVEEGKSFFEMGGTSLMAMRLAGELGVDFKKLESNPVSRSDISFKRWHAEHDAMILYCCGYLTTEFDGLSFVEAFRDSHCVVTFSYLKCSSLDAKEIASLVFRELCDKYRVVGVVGFSAGGVLAYELASLFPPHQIRLFLLDSYVPCETEGETLLEKINAYVNVLCGCDGFATLDLAEIFLFGLFQKMYGMTSDHAGASARALVSCGESWREFRKWTPDGSVACPAVFFCCSELNCGLKAWGLPDVTLEILSGIGHMELQKPAALRIKDLLSL